MTVNIAMRIRQLRQEKGLSTNNLSTNAGLSQSYVRKLENNECNPTVEALSLLCDALGTDIVTFLANGSESLQEFEILHLVKALTPDQQVGLIKLLTPSEPQIDKKS